MRVLRVTGVTPLPRNWRRSMIGSSWPRTLASPRSRPWRPGTRVVPAARRAPRASPRGRPGTARPPCAARRRPTRGRRRRRLLARCADTARPRRSSSRSSSNGRSRRDCSSTRRRFTRASVRAQVGHALAPSATSFVGRHRLHHVVDRALAQAPDAVGLLALGRDHDDRDGAGRGSLASARVAW